MCGRGEARGKEGRKSKGGEIKEIRKRRDGEKRVGEKGWKLGMVKGHEEREGWNGKEAKREREGKLKEGEKGREGGEELNTKKGRKGRDEGKGGIGREKFKGKRKEMGRRKR